MVWCAALAFIAFVVASLTQSKMKSRRHATSIQQSAKSSLAKSSSIFYTAFMIWYDMIWYDDMCWCDVMIWYDMTWNDDTCYRYWHWYGLIWCDRRHGLTDMRFRIMSLYFSHYLSYLIIWLLTIDFKLQYCRPCIWTWSVLYLCISISSFKSYKTWQQHKISNLVT